VSSPARFSPTQRRRASPGPRRNGATRGLQILAPCGQCNAVSAGCCAAARAGPRAGASASHDRRVTEATCTAAGLRLLVQARPGYRDLVRRLFFDGLPPHLLQPLTAALENIRDHLLAEGSLPRPPERR